MGSGHRRQSSVAPEQSIDGISGSSDPDAVESLRRLLKAQDLERQLIGYELHDGLAQYQAGAIMQLETCLHAIDTHAGDRLDAIRRPCEEGLRLVRTAADELRRLIGGLRPRLLDELGLIAAIETLLADLRRQGVEVSFLHPSNLPHISPEIESTLFRIAQESLSNVIKHSGAGNVNVSLEQRGDRIALTVRDDGSGFDPAQTGPDRFGLEGIRLRARVFGGASVIHSVPGEGTRLEVLLPASQPA
jgi:signal transduction histidine kinase